MRFLSVLLLAVPMLWAQGDMGNMPGMAGMQGMANMPGMQQNEAPMEASGTSFNPASSPMEMAHFSAGGWSFMAHGLVFVVETQQTGPRGADKFFSANWFMGEASHPVGGGTFRVRSMLSLDPATITNGRYPELFQTGETWHGQPIVDGQHPHNLFMELALEYAHPLGAKTKLTLYAAPVGDPALGPVAYPHRVSAAELPQATLAHHLQDSTHISYDVVTAGITRGIFGLEASGFHGAEPGEDRWIITQGAIDSYSARFTMTPNANWTGQFSAGRLTHPEALEPGDQVRTTASVTYNRPYARGNWASSVIWGRVHKTDGGANLNGYGVESVARFIGKNYVTGRIELVDKNELFLPGSVLYGDSFRVGAYTAGYTRDFYLIPRIATGLGANVTGYSMPEELHSYYGHRPAGVLVFIRFRLRES
jgi:hypothetical protein